MKKGAGNPTPCCCIQATITRMSLKIAVTNSTVAMQPFTSAATTTTGTVLVNAGVVGLVFRLTAYIQMLANFYVALYGLRCGFGKLDFKKIFTLFILYAPTQLATGGRLFVLYFSIFFFGSYLLARGI